MRKKVFPFFFLFLLCIFPHELKAETAQWLLEATYSSIIRMKNGFFKVKSGVRTGVFNQEGRELVPTSADSITDFSNGCALVLKVSDSKYRLISILHEDGTLVSIPFENEWYAGEYAFFSDGLLPVCTRKGKYGFIDAEGKEKIKFEYGSVRPFCEGIAAVSKGKSLVDQGLALLGSKKKSPMFYIEKNGVPLNLPAEIGTLSTATSFRFGEALVINTEGKRFVVDNSGRMVRMENNSRPLVFNEKYVVLKDGEKSEETSPKWEKTQDSPLVFSKGNRYGYRHGNGQNLLPAQFLQAEPFYGGCAIVQSQSSHLYGVLRLISGTVIGSLQKDSSGKPVSCTAQLPFESADAVYELECIYTNGTSVIIPTKESSNKHTLEFSFTVSENSAEYNLLQNQRDACQKLILWSETWTKEKPTQKTQKKADGKGFNRGKAKKDKNIKKQEGLFT